MQATPRRATVPGQGRRPAWGHVPRRRPVLTVALLVVLLVVLLPAMTLADLAPALLPEGSGPGAPTH